MSTTKVDTFEITGSTDARRYEDLVNRPDIVISSKSDFFATMPGDDGMVSIVTRVVDYREIPASDLATYSQPIA